MFTELFGRKIRGKQCKTGSQASIIIMDNHLCKEPKQANAVCVLLTLCVSSRDLKLSWYPRMINRIITQFLALLFVLNSKTQWARMDKQQAGKACKQPKLGHGIDRARHFILFSPLRTVVSDLFPCLLVSLRVKVFYGPICNAIRWI